MYLEGSGASVWDQGKFRHAQQCVTTIGSHYFSIATPFFVFDKWVDLTLSLQCSCYTINHVKRILITKVIFPDYRHYCLMGFLNFFLYTNLITAL
jgi:hypothetical protein